MKNHHLVQFTNGAHGSNDKNALLKNVRKVQDLIIVGTETFLRHGRRISSLRCCVRDMFSILIFSNLRGRISKHREKYNEGFLDSYKISDVR